MMSSHDNYNSDLYNNDLYNSDLGNDLDSTNNDSTNNAQWLSEWTDIVNDALDLPEPLTVIDVRAVLGTSLGVALCIKTSDGHWRCPYYDQAAGDMCCSAETKMPAEERTENDIVYIRKCFEFWTGDSPDQERARTITYCPCEYCFVENDPDSWLETMMTATDWSEFNWEDYGEQLPVFY